MVTLLATHLRLAPLVLVPALPLLAQGTPPQPAERMTPEKLWDLKRLADPRISPDGKLVLYTQRTTDLSANKTNADLWVVPIEGGAARRLTSHPASDADGSWTPDSRHIVFTSTRSGAPQLWRLAIDGGEPEQLMTVEGGVANVRLDPTGRRVSFTSDVALDEKSPLLDGLDKADARIIDGLMFRHWNAWHEGKWSHLFVADLAGTGDRKPLDLMPYQKAHTPLPPFGGAEQIAWSPDGEELAYTVKVASDAAASTDSGVWLVPVGGGRARCITEGMPGYDQDPAYSPDGRWIAFRSMARGGFESDRARLFLHDRKAGTNRELTVGLDQTVDAIKWASDSRSILFESPHRGCVHLFRIAVPDGKVTQVTSGRFNVGAFDVTADGGTIVLLKLSMERPAEVCRIAASGEGDMKALTDVNGTLYQNLALPKVEERFVTASDGQKIQCWVVKPPDFDARRKWPMLLYCQGGPQQMIGQGFSTAWNFHLMAAKGYVVLAPNRRGLPGFGQAWNDQISRDWGGQAMQDLLAATDELQREPWIDKTRCGAIGASFGGYTVYWLMGHNQPQRFAAMIAHCGVFNLDSMYGGTEELFFVNWDLGGPPWTKDLRTDYERFSPHRFVGSWDTPLLVIHGELDFRVPVTEGIQAFTSAQVRKVPSRFLYFPGEGHWVMKPQNQVLWHRVFFDWLDRWLKA